MTIDGKTVPTSFTSYYDEKNVQYFADIEAQNCLVQSLTNDVYRKLDSYQDSAKEIWDQLLKIMLGSKVGN